MNQEILSQKQLLDESYWNNDTLHMKREQVDQMLK